MSLEKDVTIIMESDVFKPAEPGEVQRRKVEGHRIYIEREIRQVKTERQCRVCQKFMHKGDKFLRVTAVNSEFGVCEPCIIAAANLMSKT